MIRQILTHIPNTAKEIVRNFYGVYGDDSNLTYREGWERIPENWYKRPTDWGILNMNADLLEWTIKYPSLARYVSSSPLHAVTMSLI